MGHYILAGDGSLIVERRATPRYDIEMSVRVRLRGSDTAVDGMIIDLSESGARIVVRAALEDGETIEIRCPTFAGTAQVVWKHEEGARVRAGLKFVTLSPKDREAIRSLLSGLVRQEEPSRVGSA